MATERPVGWRPNWSVVPGEILAEALDDREMSQSDLARRMGRPIKTINEIVNGKAAITPETAIQLERTLGISAAFWNNLETRFREARARDASERELERSHAWLANFPVPDLISLGRLNAGSSRTELLVDLLKFFAVSTPKAWEGHWSRPLASFRKSSHASSVYAMATWLRLGELEAEEFWAKPYNERAFLDLVRRARELTRSQPPTAGIARLQAAAADVGVAVVLSPELVGTHLSGAARWIRSDRPLIQISLRHQSEHQFWFTFFHEVRHLLQVRADTVDGSDMAQEGASEDEKDADEFARETLIPRSAYADFVDTGDLSATAVRSFAALVGVSPGIVVGRLQHEGRVGMNALNFLKRRVVWAAIIN